MTQPIIKLTRGVPRTDREWMDVFANLARYLRVSGDGLVISGDVTLPDESVDTQQLAPNAVETSRIAADAVTNDKLRDSASTSVIGRPQGTGGNPEDVIATTDGHFLRRSGGTLGFGAITDSDIPASLARDSEVTAAITTHEAAVDPHPQYTSAAELSSAISQFPYKNDIESITGSWSFELPVVLPPYTVATLPVAANFARGLIYVSDETGGAVPAFSDGTNWRRMTDRAVVS